MGTTFWLYCKKKKTETMIILLLLLALQLNIFEKIIHFTYFIVFILYICNLAKRSASCDSRQKKILKQRILRNS